jgi:hypothetical protein
MPSDLQVDVLLTVSGPEVTSSCGQFGRRLVLNATYVVGIGGPCSRIGEWSLLSSYSSEELQLLRGFGPQCDAGPTTAPEVTTTTGGTTAPEGTTVGPEPTNGGGALGLVPTATPIGIVLVLVITALWE